jgi:hypothetical protein
MINKNDNYFPYLKDSIIFNELKTKKELEKMGISEKSACFKPIYTSRKNTFFFFGIRYLKDESKIY